MQLGLVGAGRMGGNMARRLGAGGHAVIVFDRNPEAVRPLERVPLACQAPDDELLFVDFLNALVYEMATRRMLFSRFRVSLDGCRLSGDAWGEPVDPGRHHPAVEVKGATYTTLRVAREGDAWRAQTVIDV